MKKSKIFAAAGAAAGAVVCMAMLMFSSCAPKTVQLDFSNVPDNDRCNYMKEVCKEAEVFEGRFQGMSREEKEDAKVILNAYIEQCAGAQKLCKDSR
jgi:hypothetical protein